MNKKTLRLSRALNTRRKISNLKIHRLSVYKSNKYIYCQVLSLCGKYIITSSSSIDLDLKIFINLNFGKNLNLFICKFIGKCIAFKAMHLGIFNIAFDRSGYKYHGCIKNLAESIRKFGLKF